MAPRSRSRSSAQFRTVEPRWGTVPDPDRSSFAPSAIKWLRESAELELLPWQERVLTEWLEVDDKGNLTRKSCGLVVPRRNGKTQLLIGRMLVGMYLLGERRIVFTAQDHRTAGEVFEWMVDTIEGSETLRAALPNNANRGIRLANGQQRIELADGTRFTPATRTSRGGRGLETDLLVLDEAMLLVPEQMAALTPLVAKASAQGRGQILATSSAGSMESTVLLGIRDRGRELHGTPGGAVAYHEWSAPDYCDPADPAAWAAANPSLGTTILGADFLEAQLSLNTPESFAREHLSRWGETSQLPAVDIDAWAAAGSDKTPQLADSGVYLAFDMDHYRTAARLLLCAKDVRGRVAVHVLAAIDNENGIDEGAFARLVVEQADRWAPEAIGFDQLTGEQVARIVEAGGHRTKRLPLPRYAAACSILAQAVKDKRIVHDQHPTLVSDLARAVPKDYADGGWTFSRVKASTGPIAGAIALAIGHYLASNPDDSDTIYIAS